MRSDVVLWPARSVDMIQWENVTYGADVPSGCTLGVE